MAAGVSDGGGFYVAEEVRSTQLIIIGCKTYEKVRHIFQPRNFARLVPRL
jgi:hypothetical protein